MSPMPTDPPMSTVAKDTLFCNSAEDVRAFIFQYPWLATWVTTRRQGLFRFLSLRDCRDTQLWVKSDHVGTVRSGHAPSFRGIPDGSVEFQILLELVGVLRLHQFSIQANGFLLDIMAMASNLEAMAQWPPSGPKSNGMGQFLV